MLATNPASEENPLNRISIVLCRPEGQINIGAVCRAMKTMGITKLKIANMQSPEDIQTIKTWSLSAFDIYEQAQHYPSLKEAIAQSSLVAATSRRLGKNRKFFSLTAKEFAQSLPQHTGEIAIVFGNEKNGLNEEEMDLCHTLIYIPTSDLYPSLNLSQAIQILCYELFSHSVASDYHFESISADESHKLAQNITHQLDSFGFFAISKATGKRHTFNFWHAIIARAAISKKEATFLERMFRQITHMKTKESLDCADEQSSDS